MQSTKLCCTKKPNLYGVGFYKSGVRPDSYRDTLPGYSFINYSAQKTQPLWGWVSVKVASTYSPTVKTAVPSAQSGLTSLFGMGRGGP